MRKSVVLIVAVAVAAIAAALLYAILMIRGGFSARATPSKLEAFLASRMRRLAIPENARETKNPVLLNDEVLGGAMRHWAEHCGTCHANNGSGNTVVGQNVYPPAPDMREPGTQNLSDGELFYIIENGIRLSAMPAWGEPGEQDASWELVHFIRHLPRITAEEEKWMEQFTPRTPADIEQRRAEDEFLSGGSAAPKARSNQEAP